MDKMFSNFLNSFCRHVDAYEYESVMVNTFYYGFVDFYLYRIEFDLI